ncbi:DUF1919 domain-containing protein [Enterococcus casseliflavus]|uniref:DUF1919 domain-containing protein n=1 Tax=Enterococcus casseliflavus TaxID=37734 RepID=UPI00115753A8|nr:DUF1919 domain-containing protein [Enterococcus casseliflavus]
MKKIKKLGLGYYILTKIYYLNDMLSKFNPFIRIKRKKFFSSNPCTIISNNCWGGVVQKRYMMTRYNTPTVGLYFFPDDYIRFVTKFNYYISIEIAFTDIEKSNHAEVLKEKGQNNVIVGVLDDVEIIFLHYKSKNEAKEKWNRRRARINYKNLLFKFNDQNGATYKHLKDFDRLNEKKIMFVANPDYASEFKSAVLHEDWIGKEYVIDDVGSYRKFVKLDEIL